MDRGLEFRICVLSAMGSCRKILSNVPSTACISDCHIGSVWVIRGGDGGGWGTDGTVETEERAGGALPRES